MIEACTIGDKWNNESYEVKAQFKALADEIKRKHAEDHPDYQYAPRKPSEKKRRNTGPKTKKAGKGKSEQKVNTPEVTSESSAVSSENSAQTPRTEVVFTVKNDEPEAVPAEDALTFVSLPEPPAESFDFMDFDVEEYEQWIDNADAAHDAAFMHSLRSQYIPLNVNNRWNARDIGLF
jgi:hypothetical protein